MKVRFEVLDNESSADAASEAWSEASSEEGSDGGIWREKTLIEKLRNASVHEGADFKLEMEGEDGGELEQDDQHTYLVSAENIAQQVSLHGDEAIVIDHLFYDVAEEAEERVNFHLFEFFEDIIVNMFCPISGIYIYWMYGWFGLQMRGFAPPSVEKDAKEADNYHHHHDPESPKYQPPGVAFFMVNNVIAVIRAFWLAAFFMAGYATMNDGDGLARGPYYHFMFSVIVNGFFAISLSMKKAFRKKASEKRLYLQRERRAEELIFGWLPLPWNVALFQIRLAAYLVGKVAVESEYITFDRTSVKDMEAAIGRNILHIVDREGLRAIKPVEEHVVDEKTGKVSTVTRPGAQVSMLAFLLRLALDNSFASPPFGKPANNLYLDNFASKYWGYYIMYMQVLPFIVDNTVRSGGSYNGWSIALVVLSAFFVWFNGDAPPQGWTYAAVLTLSRKRDMLAFLNSLLTNRLPEGTQKNMFKMNDGQQTGWEHLMDLSRVTNLSRWSTMREIVLRFDSGYRSRTDGNGAVIIIYIAIFTLLLLIGTVLIDGKLSWSNYAYYFLMHISLLLPMSWFAATMSLEGDECNDVADQSKMALTLGMVHLEERHETGHLTREQSLRVPAARFAATQLQESLSAGSRLYSIQMLSVIDLNRTLVISILFAVVTQITLLIENIDFDS